MGRAKLPASLQKGNTWSKEQLQQLDALEQEMRGKDDVVDEVPEHLDDFAKVYYGYLIDNLKESKIPISNLDKPMIEMTADCLSKIYQCQVAIKEQGLVVRKVDRGGNESLAPNPHIKIQHDYQAKFIQASSTLGLTPSARSTLASMQMDNREEEQDEVINLIKSLKE